ncbi:MAG: tryptophan--tRNA ligase [Candidatus Odinarchaeota archaeon]
MTQEFQVTPWEVTGIVDYDKLIQEFGTERITSELLKEIERVTGELHPLLRRGFFFSHRDMPRVLEAYKKGDGFFLYTGRGPTGHMHIGHLIPFLFVKWLQDKFKAPVIIQITDDEKFLYKEELTLETTRKYSFENACDIIACGFNPDLTFIFQDSEYTNFYPLAVKIAKKITLSTVKAVFGFKNEANIGLIFFPAVQAMPCFLLEKQCLIPAAIDQDPYWRIQRDIAPKLGYPKTAAIHSKFLPGLEGPTGKMSASKEQTAIYLTDKPETVRKKIIKYAFTGGQPSIVEQREKGGNPNICTVFQWLNTLLEEDDAKIKNRENMCLSGKLICGECKNYLVEKLTNFLIEHQQRRQEAKNKIDSFKYTGTLAREMWNKKW